MDSLTLAEQRLRERGVSGELITFEDLEDDDAVVRAPFIRELVLNGADGDPRGLRLRGARVRDVLDLAFVVCQWPLSFTETTFEDDIVLEDARLPAFELQDCTLVGLSGLGTVIDHDLLLNGVTISGPVVLGRAKIRGTLNCRGATLNNPEGYALLLDGAVIGDVYLHERFEANGEVRALDAKINGIFGAKAVTFNKPEGTALSLDRAEIGAVFLQDLQAKGEVRTEDTRIKGSLSCASSVLDNREGTALTLGRAQIGGSVYLDKDFQARGEVQAISAVIEGQLSCRGATLDSPSRNALSLDRAEIGAVFLDQGFHARGEVRAVDAVIKGPLVCKGAVFDNQDGVALSLERAQIGSSVFLDEDFQARGEVRAFGTGIKGQLSCAGATLESPKGRALVLNGAEIGGSVVLTASKVSGEVRAPGAKVGGSLVCVGATLTNRGGYALILRHATVTTLYLRSSGISGGIDLYRAQIVTLDDDLGLEGGLGSWHGASPLVLEGFSYAQFADTSTWSPGARHRWIKRTSEFQPATWSQLIQVYRAHGFEDDAIKTGIAMQNDRLSRASLRRHQKTGGWVLRATIGHGYRPSRAIPWAAVIIGAFAIVVWRAGDSHFTAAKGVHGAPQPIVYAADKFLPVIDFGQASRWTASGWVSWVEWLVILLGWILSTIVVAGFTRIVRTI